VTTGDKFRWSYYDEDVGETWSKWHTVALPCSSCCCDGPDQGKHQQSCVVYDDPDDYLPNFGAHTRLDPQDIPSWTVVEWSATTDSPTARAPR
jgi:hypothetical protein